MEQRVEDHKNDVAISNADVSALQSALDAWLVNNPKPRRERPPEPKHWHKQWQPRIRTPLFLLLAQAELRAALADGKAKRADSSTLGWETQVHDGWCNDGRQALL
jgi:hypothetical protein